MKVLFYAICLFFIVSTFYACQKKAQDETSSNVAVQAPQANPTKLYAMYCTTCHGEDGRAGVGGAKNLAASAASEEDIIKMISNGSENKKMMAYGNLLNDKEIKALADYVIALRE